MSRQDTSAADQAYIDEYFLERRAKEIRRFIVALVAMVGGLIIMGFSESIAGSFELPVKAVDSFGLVLNLIGVACLAIWLQDGKDYVFPKRK